MDYPWPSLIGFVLLVLLAGTEKGRDIVLRTMGAVDKVIVLRDTSTLTPLRRVIHLTIKFLYLACIIGVPLAFIFYVQAMRYLKSVMSWLHLITG